MKTVYIVRHGESETNVGVVFGGESAPLTELGRKQAVFIAERASKLPVEVVIASSMKRAMETGEVIAQKIGKPIEYSDLFRERRHPSSHTGVLKNSLEFLREEKEFLERFGDPSWRFEDGENFADLNTRASEALAFLEERPESEILVASHGIFMSILLARAVLGEELNGNECIRFIRGFYMKNTGISILRKDPENHWPLSWQVRVWNDHSHLAD